MADNDDAGVTPAPPGATPDPDVPLGEGGKKALEAERKARREAEQKLRAAEERVARMETDRVRTEIATSRNVPVDLLTGATREDLEAQADRLVEFRGGNNRPTTGRPREKLTSGAGYDDDTGETNMARVADQIIDRGV